MAARHFDWVDHLLEYERVSTLQLGNPRRPWSYYTRQVDDLWRRTGRPAQVCGIFRITLDFDPAMRAEGSAFTAFVMEHEFAHMKGKHGFWSLLAFILCLPLWPLVRIWQERIADRHAAARLHPGLFLKCATRLHRGGLIHRVVYGSPLTRTRRAFRLTEEAMLRWAGLSLVGMR